MTGTEKETRDEPCRLPAPRQLVIAVWMITFMLVTYTMYLASSLLVPITISLLVYLAMRPFVSQMKHIGVPGWVAAGLVTVLFGVIVAGVATLIAQPAQYWANKGPESLVVVGEKLRSFKRPLEAFDTAEAQIEKLTESSERDAPLKVEVSAPAIVDKQVLFSSTGQLLAFLLAVTITSFFLLASDDDLLRRLMRTLPTLSDRKKALSIVLQIQEMVSSYLAQITAINFCLGCAVAVMTWFCGMPTPLLWGVIAMLLNYIPFVGAMIGAAIIFLAAAVEFDQLWWAVVVAGLYVTLTSVEANFITPMTLGRTMKVGPVLVLIACAFWGFLWGLPGVIVAVPMLIVVRQVCSSFPALRPIAIMLGEDDCTVDQSCEEDVEEQSRPAVVSTAAGVLAQ